MARSKSSAGYPEAFNLLVVTVGKLQKEVTIPVEGTGLNVNSMRTTLQSFFAAVKREGTEHSANPYMVERAEYAAKVVVRANGNAVVLSHRDHSVLGLAVTAALANSVACHDGPLVSSHDGGSVREHDGPEHNRDVIVSRMEAGMKVAPFGNDSLESVPKAPDSRAMLDELNAMPDNPAFATGGEHQGYAKRLVAKLPPIQSAPGSLLDMVSGESSAPRPAVEQKYKRADGRSYEAQEDGEPTWGFNDDGEPKVNQFF